MESEWNYNVDEAPEREALWLTVDIGRTTMVKRITMQIAIDSGFEVIAWKPQEPSPEPAPVPLKPEQITSEDDCWDCHLRSKIIAEVEKRTRKIVEWEQKYGK